MATTQQDDAAASRQEILRLFHQKAQNQTECQLDILHLVRLIGGIEVVMATMLNSTDHMFTDEQLIALHQYLSGLSSSHSRVVSGANKAINKNNILQKDLQWTLDPNNNTLHQQLPFIEKTVFSKRTYALGAIVPALWGVAIALHNYWLYILCVLMNIVSIPLCIAYLSSINKAMIPQIIRSFDFWVKVGTSVMWVIYNALYWMTLDIRDDNLLNSDYSYITIVIGIQFVLFLAVVSSLDGIHQWSRKAKIILTVPCALFFVFMHIYGLFLYEEVDIQIPLLGEYGVFSIRDRLINSYYVLFLFLAKQTFNGWRRKNQCVGISCSPFVKWEEPKAENSRSQTFGSQQHVVGMKTGRVDMHSHDMLDGMDGGLMTMRSFATMRDGDIDTALYHIDAINVVESSDDDSAAGGNYLNCDDVVYSPLSLQERDSI